MRLKWLGHSCFLITSEAGPRIITDPYTTGGDIHYSPVNETADIVTVSHDHFDHNAISSVPGKPDIVKGSGMKNIKGIQFSRAAWGDCAVDTSARRIIRKPRPKKTKMLLSAKLLSARTLLLLRIQLIRPVPVRMKATPSAIITALGAPHWASHWASLPGEANPSDMLTPSWIMATGPHRIRGIQAG